MKTLVDIVMETYPLTRIAVALIGTTLMTIAIVVGIREAVYGILYLLQKYSLIKPEATHPIPMYKTASGKSPSVLKSKVFTQLSDSSIEDTTLPPKERPISINPTITKLRPIQRLYQTLYKAINVNKRESKRYMISKILTRNKMLNQLRFIRTSTLNAVSISE